MEKTKRNRKVAMLLSIVLMFTLISTCMMSGTLAKYVTNRTGSDNARVAKWGVEIETFGDELFVNEYATEDPKYSGIINSSVQSWIGDDVVAPGTFGKLGGFKINGSPEVACVITVDVYDYEFTGWTDESGMPYTPIYWTLYNGPMTVIQTTDFYEFVSYLEAIEIPVAPNQELSDFADYEITWEWPFYVDPMSDQNDTYLGNKATAPEVSLFFGIDVTQID